MIRIAAILVGISERRGHDRPHVGRCARVAAALFLIALPALAGADLRDGQAAYDRGDYTTAFAEFTRAAEQGNLGAQYRLGQMYRKGLGVVRNDDLALHWIRSSAEQGFSVAEVSLGTMYSQGDGVARDYVQAYIWFDVAAKQTIDPRKRAETRKYRDQVALLMTSSQIAEARGRSRELALKLTGPHCDVG